MRIALALMSRTGLTPSQLALYATKAERAGYDALTLTESYNDVFPFLAACAGATKRVAIGTSIANTGLRHPALMAMGAAAIDELSDGRFFLGLGVGTQWFTREGLEYAKERPLRAVREYVDIIRLLLRNGSGTYGGEIYQLEPFRLDFKPLRPEVPIWLAVMGPQMARLAGEIADGVFVGLTPVENIANIRDQIAEGATQAGRSPSAVEIGALVRVCVDDDPERAREGARASVPMYLTFPGYARHVTDLGYGRVVTAVQAAAAQGDWEQATRSVPDELVERVVVFGSPDCCRRQLEQFRRAGVQLAVITPRTPGGEWTEVLNRVIATFSPSVEAMS